MESGLETDPAKAMERASAMHASARPALESLIRDNPGILFVAGAGNANESEDSFGSLPQILDLPNLIVVGAVGTSGVPASFTTFGKQVRIYAQGQAVEVRSPGGSSERGEGTSFAAPFVTRAAAMMLAANPKLTPATLIDGLLTTATDGEGGTRLLHPAEAVGWARTHKEQRR
jgi:subtilisin family serine protease